MKCHFQDLFLQSQGSNLYGYRCQDKKFAKCEEYAEVVFHSGDSAKMFTTSNLVSHLKANHPVVYQRFCKCKNKKEAKDRMLEKRVEFGD